MSQRTTWILGRGGLLGSALSRKLAGAELVPGQPPRWGAPDLRDRLRAGARELAARVAATGGPFCVYWCAGSGVVGSTAESLASETQALRDLLLALAEQPALRQTPGCFLLTSSAGGVHGGGGASRISEHSPPTPISPYGRCKLEQERVLAELAPRLARLSTLTARVSNLYGPGQRLDKQQGLISHIARSVVRGVPVRIYVPLDTTRDYLFVDDAARALAAGVERLSTLPAGSHVLKLYCSERDTSIASLLAMFRSIAKRRLQVISGLHRAALEQPRHLSFRSSVWPDSRALLRTDLVAGMGLVYRAQLRAFQLGSPARP